MSDLENWRGCAAPDLPCVSGHWVRIDRADFKSGADAEALFSVMGGPENTDLWTYIPLGPFLHVSEFAEVMSSVIDRGGWQTHLISDVKTGAPLGMASYMRIRPEAGSAEVGCIVFSKQLQRTAAATEAMYLMARHVFEDQGYRRYEWKCNNANEASKRAALRLGFTFEGVFRQDLVMKGRNRDTAWYSMLDSEWPAAKAAFEAWLAPENFDQAGRQKRRLADVIF